MRVQQERKSNLRMVSSKKMLLMDKILQLVSASACQFSKVVRHLLIT